MTTLCNHYERGRQQLQRQILEANRDLLKVQDSGVNLNSSPSTRDYQKLRRTTKIAQEKVRFGWLPTIFFLKIFSLFSSWRNGLLTGIFIIAIVSLFVVILGWFYGSPFYSTHEIDLNPNGHSFIQH